MTSNMETNFIYVRTFFQYFSSVPVLHYLQVILFLKIETFCINILYNTLWNYDVPITILGG
jgi:hypothetical protein